MQLIWAACAHAACAPGDLEQEAINVAYMESVARLDVPAAVHAVAPQLCAGFLGWLEGEGRLGGGREMGTYLIAMQSQYAEVASGRSKPVKNPGSKLGRNDPCPCGSGKKYKKCCLNR